MASRGRGLHPGLTNTLLGMGLEKKPELSPDPVPGCAGVGNSMQASGCEKSRERMCDVLCCLHGAD